MAKGRRSERGRERPSGMTALALRQRSLASRWGSGEEELPTWIDQTRITQGATVSLGVIVVEGEYGPPLERIAKLGLGDRPEGIAW